VTVSSDVVLAFLAGISSILGAGYSLRRARREERDACARRIEELTASYDRGIDRGLHMSEREDE